MAQICTRVSVSYRGHKNSGSRSVVKLLMRDEVIAVNIAKLTELLGRKIKLHDRLRLPLPAPPREKAAARRD
jgi:hypothetical protein